MTPERRGVVPATPTAAQARIRENVRRDRMGRWAEDCAEYFLRTPRERASYEVFRSTMLQRWGRELRGGQDRFAEADSVIGATWLQPQTPPAPAPAPGLSVFETWIWASVSLLGGVSMGRSSPQTWLAWSTVAAILATGLLLMARGRR